MPNEIHNNVSEQMARWSLMGDLLGGKISGTI